MQSNAFNDLFLVMFRCEQTWCLLQFPCTTDPGTYYRNHPLNVRGTAVVVPGQYPELWELGRHRGAYDALVQVGQISVYRDDNFDSIIDCDASTVHLGIFGINCHRANATASKQVDRWSAGCQVFKDARDFEVLLSLCRRSRINYGNSFTYTLLTEQDFDHFTAG